MRAADSQTIAETIIALAAQHRVRIAVAESLSGGLLSAALVGVPGASSVFSGGVIAYDTALKATLLGVDRELLAARGPVDRQVAQQMATGARAACRLPGSGAADFGVATTGVAGPDPDPQTGLAPGTVWLGVSSLAGTREVLLENLSGGRLAIREQSVRASLQLLLAHMRQHLPSDS